MLAKNQISAGGWQKGSKRQLILGIGDRVVEFGEGAKPRVVGVRFCSLRPVRHPFAKVLSVLPNSGLKPRAIEANEILAYECLDLVLLGAVRRVGALVEELPRIETDRS
jgi:hypothetical protein